jgi:NADH-quinone oxidoreductase subunit N
MTFPVIDARVILQLAPMLVMLFGGVVFVVSGALERTVGARQRIFAIALYVLAILYAARLWNVGGDGPILGGMIAVDRFSLFFTVVVSVCAIGTILTSANYLSRFGMDRGEFLSMIFFSTTGMVVLVSALDLIAVFLGIELMSLAIYVLVAFRRRDVLSNEAALKYFLIGAFAIGFFLYGVSLIYGVAGSTNFERIAAAVFERGLAESPVFLLAVALMLAGLGFKVSAVPFHMWTPDVYQGAPTPVTSLMATAVKAASFGAFLRLFLVCFLPSRDEWVGVVWVLAVITMTAGNLMALVQRNLKRMLAYSSIAHAGYILVGVAAIGGGDSTAASSVMFYVLSYAFMTMGAFALVSAIEKRGVTRGLEEPDYAGLGLQRPFLGFSTAVFMFSLAGIPPTAGFFAKYYVFGAAVERGMTPLAVIGVLNSALALYYYLRVIVAMYMRKSETPVPVHADLGVHLVLLVSLLAVLWFGVGPTGIIPGVENVLEWARSSLAVATTGF